jgi:hypothetical protein
MNTRFYQLAMFFGFITYLTFNNDLTVFYYNGTIANIIKCVPFLIIMVMYPVGVCWMTLDAKKHQRTKHYIALFGGVPFFMTFTYVSLTYFGVMHTLVAITFIAFYLLSAYVGIKRHYREYGLQSVDALKSLFGTRKA